MNIQLNLSWQGGMQGFGLIKSDGLETQISIPAVYGGLGKYSNPKELYVASTAACFLSTLTAICANKKLPLDALTVETTAEEEGDHFTIRHTANLVLSKAATEEDAAKASAYTEKADEICVVGNLARKAGVDVSAKANITFTA